MRTRFFRRPATLLVAVGAVGAIAAAAFAANPLWARGNLIPFADPADSPSSDVAVAQFFMVGNSSQNWHAHSGHFYGVITQGVLVEDLGCGRVQEFPAGTAFHTPPYVVHQFRNEGHQVLQVQYFQVWDGSLPFNVPGEEPTDCN